MSELVAAILRWSSGKKSLIGSLILSLLGTCWSLDVLANGHAAWLSEEQYIALGTAVAGLTGACMRLAIRKAEPPKNG